MSKSAGKKFLKGEKIKSENKKAVKKFALLMIVGGIIGAVIGGVSNMTSVQGMGMSLKDGIAEFCYVISPWAVVICNAGAILCGMIYYQKGKKLYLALRDKDEDEAEEEYERIDAIFSKGMIAINIGMVVSYGCFACFAVNIINYAEESGIKMLVLLCIVLVAFLGGMLGGVKLSQLYVDLMRVMNPRLSGSVYDSNFHKKWEESCDEYEKMMIYKSAYKAFRTANKACSVIWVVSVILGMFYGIGALPAVMVTIIWGIILMSYYKEAYRLEHGSDRK